MEILLFRCPLPTANWWSVGPIQILRENSILSSLPLITELTLSAEIDADMLNLPVGQMAIFYCGKVNVYDGVPADKAQAIMQLAARSVHFFQNEPIDGTSAQRHFPGSGVKVNVIPARPTTSHTDVDGQTSRQVSLQRYLEKRKDRGIYKIRRKIGPPSSGLEMYLNQQMRIQIVSGQSSPTGVSCPAQPGQSRLQCYSIEKQVKDAGCAADLFDRA